METLTIFFTSVLASGVYANWSRSQHKESFLVIPEDYKANSAPLGTGEDEEIFTIKVDIEVWAITEVSLPKQLVEVDLRVSFEWVDYRIEVSPNVTSNRTWLLLGKHDVESVWKPIFLFRNCKGCSALSFEAMQTTELYIDREEATFFGRHRVLDRFTCAINLRAYPMDIQTCPVQLYIYEETYDAMRLNHTYPDKPAIILSNMTLSEFSVPPILKTHCTFTEDDETYACLEIRVQLEHLVVFHLMTSYAPTLFIVILSWISFWLPVDMAPARVALGLTSLLTLATRLDQAQKDLPPVAYVKAIDVWMFACILMVSASLCEFAISHYRWRLSKPASESASDSKSAPLVLPIKPAPKIAKPQYKNTFNTVIQVRPYMVRKEAILPPPDPPTNKPSKAKDGTTIDRISRFAFPLFFVFFNIIYWCHYVTYYK